MDFQMRGIGKHIVTFCGKHSKSFHVTIVTMCLPTNFTHLKVQKKQKTSAARFLGHPVSYNF